MTPTNESTTRRPVIFYLDSELGVPQADGDSAPQLQDAPVRPFPEMPQQMTADDDR